MGHIGHVTGSLYLYLYWLRCTMCSGSFPGVKTGRGMTLTPHPLLVPWSRKSRAIPLLPLWTVRSVQGLSVCKMVHFAFTYWLRDAPTSLIYSCTLCPHCIYVFCIYLRINSDQCHLQHKLIGFYNRDEKCLQRGTDWVFK